jgi:ubiquinone/menaquinone biosynthesis C-methylase UbiE
MDTDPVRDAYDRLASDYDRRWRPYINATLDAVLEVLTLRGDEAVLDVPCGTGELERGLLAKWPNLRLTGVDLSTGMLERARGKDVDCRVRWIEADVNFLPLTDQTFDYVVCANSFHYFQTPQQSLSELRRVLRPGGKLVLIDWCDDYFACKLCSLWLRWTDPAFYRTYSLRRCSSLVIQAELQIEEACRFRANWPWGLMRFVCHRGNDLA